MNRKLFLVLFAAVLLLTGCSMRTVDQLYAVPKRSEEYTDLQKAMDSAMAGLEFCAPLTGENQQAVQMADLDGDGVNEYLLYAKGGSERPLRILIFRHEDEQYVHVDTIESNGTAFDQVEYVQMDGIGGVEVIVGRQLDAQVLRSVSVYSFSHGESEQLVFVNYTKFLTVDLDLNGLSELFILRPGQTDTDRGIAEVYGIENGVMERSNEVNMSEPAQNLKRIIVGQLHGGHAAVFVASAVGDTAIITDVYAMVNGLLTNVTFSNESGTSVKTMRNYYVYADDIDNDGVVELPSPIAMVPLDAARSTDRQELIRWYAMTSDGGEINKVYTYHNFVGGWYMQLEGVWAPRLSVLQDMNHYDFYIWDEDYRKNQKVMTVYILTGQNREEEGLAEERFILHKTDSVVYAASVMPAAEDFDITQESIIRSFHLIQQDWKTGET